MQFNETDSRLPSHVRFLTGEKSGTVPPASGELREFVNADLPTSQPPVEVSQVVEHLFRHEAGKMVATLTGIFGVEHLTLAEDVVQEALARALQTWPFYGVPKNPSAWLMQTARNRALDVVRRQKNFHYKEAEIVRVMEREAASPDEAIFSEEEIADDRLRMMFVCCHPAIPAEAQVALALKTLGGFGVTEIASAFLTTDAAIAKRLTRAKQKIAEAKIPFEIPAGAELAQRLDGVLQSLYLLFNEGYKASAGDQLIREDICEEAIRLAEVLAKHPAGMAFVASVAATVYFCRSMAGGMDMPGGWTMSMMWMRMPDQTWFASAISFLLMWLAMMVAMMMPSALPTFLKTRRQWVSLCYMACGYFAIWLAAGVAIYLPGVALATVVMQSDLISRAVPLLFGASLIAAGAFQFTRWKMTHLLRCRSPFGCAASCPQNETSFRLGCKQGVACCVCCAAPMAMLLALGMMNPLVIIVVAMVIAAEKLLPQPAMVARLVGISAIIAGIASICAAFLRPS